MFMTRHVWRVTFHRSPLWPPSSVRKWVRMDHGVADYPLAGLSADAGRAGHPRVRMRWTVWLGPRGCARSHAPPVEAGTACEAERVRAHRCACGASERHGTSGAGMKRSTGRRIGVLVILGLLAAQMLAQLLPARADAPALAAEMRIEGGGA